MLKAQSDLIDSYLDQWRYVDKKTQALVEQYAKPGKSLLNKTPRQQSEVRQILAVFAETNLKTFLSRKNVTSEAKKESLSLFQKSLVQCMNIFLR